MDLYLYLRAWPDVDHVGGHGKLISLGEIGQMMVPAAAPAPTD
jgi:hypothetical protein